MLMIKRSDLSKGAGQWEFRRPPRSAGNRPPAAPNQRGKHDTAGKQRRP